MSNDHKPTMESTIEKLYENLTAAQLEKMQKAREAALYAQRAIESNESPNEVEAD